MDQSDHVGWSAYICLHYPPQEEVKIFASVDGSPKGEIWQWYVLTVEHFSFLFFFFQELMSLFSLV